MSTEQIYGGWSEKRHFNGGLNANLQFLWDWLSAQPGRPQNGLSQRKNEIIELWTLFSRQNPDVILEIGTAQGGTFAGWCYRAKDNATLISIDRCIDDCRPRPGDPVNPEIYKGPLKFSHDGGGVYHLKQGSQTVHAINGWSHEATTLAKLAAVLEGRKIDFLFHDASHSAEMFATDFQLYWPMVAEGGVFASHDIAPSADPNCNKNVEWERIKREETYSACYEYRPHPSVTEMGIGVLIK